MISQKAKYALRALFVLARQPAGNTLQTQELAERASVPKRFLEQILLDLKLRGLVASRRGQKGGYSLLKPAAKITFGEVLRIIDGPIAPLPCLSLTAYRRCEDCRDEQTCEIRHVFGKAYEATRRVLDQVTLGQAMEETGAAGSHPAAPAALLKSLEI